MKKLKRIFLISGVNFFLFVLIKNGIQTSKKMVKNIEMKYRNIKHGFQMMKERIIHYLKLTKIMLGISFGIFSVSAIPVLAKQNDSNEIKRIELPIEDILEELKENENKDEFYDKAENRMQDINQNIIKFAEEKALYISYLKEYSSYFHLDSKKVIELARNTTNHYENFTEIINNDQLDLSNPEAACMIFVYLLQHDDLAIKLEELGYTKEDLITDTEPELLSYDHIEDLVLKNGQGYSEYVGKICDLFGIKDKCMVLAVSYSEIDKDNPKDASRTKNNFGGMMTKDFKLKFFSTPEEGIIELCGNYKDKYDKYDISTIDAFAVHYVKGRKGEFDEEAQGWAYNVKGNYYQICENYDFYFSPNEQDEVRLLALK